MSDQTIKHQVGAVLTTLMSQAQIDESKLAKACNISLASLSRIKNNPDSNPTISTLRPVAEFFNITIDQLLGYSPLDPKNSLIKNIPIIENNDVFNWLENKTTKSPIKSWLLYEFDSGENTFATECKINLNNNVLQTSLIIVDQKRKMQHEDLIFIYNNKIKQFFLRQVSIDDQEQVYLKPIEIGFSDYTLLKNCPNINLIGVVIETRVLLQK